jgi:hypothetical protein
MEPRRSRPPGFGKYLSSFVLIEQSSEAAEGKLTLCHCDDSDDAGDQFRLLCSP